MGLCGVAQLGFPGVMLNGFTNIGDAQAGWYYDEERFLPFWERAESPVLQPGAQRAYRTPLWWT